MTTIDSADVPDYTSLLRLDGSRYLVLGAGQGIGRQSAHALVANGARVICVDLDPARVAAVAAELGPAATAWTGDITQAAAVKRLVEHASERFGTLTGVVDIVGMAVPRDIAQMTEEIWDQQFDISLRHVMLIMREALPLMEGVPGASFTFVSSVSALYGSAHNSAYGAAKAALVSLVRSAAVEFGPLQVRVNAVSPGIIQTPLHPAESYQDLGGRLPPLGRAGQVSDVVDAILFLESSPYITGEILHVDGGQTAGH